MTSETHDQPLVDVLLPAYNAAATIEESIDSLLAQTERNIRILVVDDGSTDGTTEILKQLAARDARVQPIFTPNGGIVAALNLALSKASAPYIARQDADDISFPDRIAKQIAEFERRPEVVALSGSCVHIDQKGALTGTTFKPINPELADYDAYPSEEPYLLHPFLMVRREAFENVGGYRHVVHSEDTDLYWRLRERGSLLNVDEAYGKMRLHAGSVSNASIVNGRIMAVTSQLAAISAHRRADGRVDLEFREEARAELKEARTLERILEVAGKGLDPAEQEYLRYSSCVSLLDMSLSRSYELEEEDCRFIRRAYASMPAARFKGRSTVGWAYRTAVIRYLKAGKPGRLSAIFDLGALGRAFLLRLGRA